MAWKFYAIPVITFFSLLVIFYPQVFYKEGANKNALTVIDSKLQREDFAREIRVARETLSDSEARLKSLKSKAPWVGQTPQNLQQAINVEQIRVDSERVEYNALIKAQEKMLAERRGLNPVFSQLAFDEARDLFWRRQGMQKDFSIWMWMWDLVFFGSGNAESIMEWLVMALLRLIWNLSVGVIAGVLDFAIRLPFWIKEYQTYPDEVHLPENYGDLSDVDQTPKLPHSHETNLIEGTEDFNQPVGMTGSERMRWWLDALLFYAIALCGALGGTAALLFLIWSPLWLIVVVAWLKNQWDRRKRQREFGGFGGYEGHQD